VRGVIVRHFVLPNNLAGTDLFVRFVATRLGRGTYVNIMAAVLSGIQGPQLSGTVAASD